MSGSTRGSKLSRVATFFREAPYDEATITLQYVTEIMSKRKHPAGAQAAAPKAKRPRPSRAKAAPPTTAETVAGAPAAAMTAA